jgi:RimJ/RimL family protein N-acetyltransferase
MSPNIKEPRSLIPIIREATEADAASLAALVQQLGRNDPFMVVSGFDPVTGVELLRSVIGATSDDGLFRIFVAECSGEMAGLAICRRHPPPERDRVLQLDIGVDAQWRRVRVGTALVQFVIDWAQQNAIERVQLAVVSANTPAVALYERNGFEVEGTLRRSFRLDDDVYDVHVMARLLA